ncbi:hypothetical protein [Micromonospora sp. RV43]|uniref:hypothetical protein n=1 Tax=Micromonospora sp. RV43 TaxID=1661387 RepID=UPI00064BCD59|nr:hypothetical protein [Micromonospora sp. RV43]
MDDAQPIVTFNTDAALLWLTEPVTVNGKTMTRAQHLGIRKKYKSDRDKIENWTHKLIEALQNFPCPAAWFVHPAAEVEMYPTPDLGEGGGLVVVRVGRLRLASSSQMSSEFAFGEELPGVEAAVEALSVVARLANSLGELGQMPHVSVDADALEEWLMHPEHAFLGDDWSPASDAIAVLVQDLNESPSPLARRAFQLHGLTEVFAIKVSGGKTVFGADVDGGGRISTVPLGWRDLISHPDTAGPQAAITALVRVAEEINAAYPRR